MYDRCVGGINNDEGPNDRGEVKGHLDHRLKDTVVCALIIEVDLVLMYRYRRVHHHDQVLEHAGEAEIEGLCDGGVTMRMGKEAIRFHLVR